MTGSGAMGAPDLVHFEAGDRTTTTIHICRISKTSLNLEAEADVFANSGIQHALAPLGTS